MEHDLGQCVGAVGQQPGVHGGLVRGCGRHLNVRRGPSQDERHPGPGVRGSGGAQPHDAADGAAVGCRLRRRPGGEREHGRRRRQCRGNDDRPVRTGWRGESCQEQHGCSENAEDDRRYNSRPPPASTVVPAMSIHGTFRPVGPPRVSPSAGPWIRAYRTEPSATKITIVSPSVVQPALTIANSRQNGPSGAGRAPTAAPVNGPTAISSPAPAGDTGRFGRVTRPAATGSAFRARREQCGRASRQGHVAGTRGGASR